MCYILTPPAHLSIVKLKLSLEVIYQKRKIRDNLFDQTDSIQILSFNI